MLMYLFVVIANFYRFCFAVAKNSALFAKIFISLYLFKRQGMYA